MPDGYEDLLPKPKAATATVAPDGYADLLPKPKQARRPRHPSDTAYDFRPFDPMQNVIQTEVTKQEVDLGPAAPPISGDIKKGGSGKNPLSREHLALMRSGMAALYGNPAKAAAAAPKGRPAPKAPQHPSSTAYDAKPKPAAGARGVVAGTPNTTLTDFAKVGSGELGQMTEGVTGLVKSLIAGGAESTRVAARQVAKPGSDYLAQKFPSGMLLKPEHAATLDKMGYHGKTIRKTIQNLDPSQVLPFVEAITREANAKGESGLAQAGAGLKDMLLKVAEGDEEAATDLMGMVGAFAISAASGTAVKGMMPRPKVPHASDVPAKALGVPDINAQGVRMGQRGPTRTVKAIGRVSEATEPVAAPQKFAASNAASSDLRKSLSLPEMKRTPTPEGKAEVKHYDEVLSKSRTIVKDVERGKRAPVLNQDEIANIRLAETTGKVRYNELTDKINEGIKKGEDVEALVGLREGIRSELDSITQASRYVGTEQSRAFRERNVATYDDYSPAGLYNDWRAVAGKELTSERKAQSAVFGQKITKLEKQVADLEKFNAKLQAETSLREMAKRGGSKAPRGSIDAIRERRTKAAANIAEKWKASKPTEIMSDPFGAQATYILSKRIADIAPDIKELARTYIDEGLLKFEDVTGRIKATMKASGVDISDEEIYRSLSGEYDHPKKTRSPGATAMDDLRKQAGDTIESQRAKMVRLGQGLRQRAATRDFKSKPKNPIPAELERLRIQLEAEKVKANDVRAELVAEREAANRTPIEKAIAGFAEMINVPRTLVASTDFSGLLNQGAFVTAANPGLALRALKKSLGALTDARAAEAIGKLKIHPHYNRAKAAGVEFFEATSSAPNEFFSSRLIGKLPNIKLSNNQMAALLNEIRIQKFAKMVEANERPWFGIFGQKKDLNLAELRQVGEYVNTTTGVGTGPVATSLKALNKSTGALFAPGFMVSRWKTAFASPLFNAMIRKNPKLATLILRDYLKVAGVMYGTIYTLKEMGLDVELDRRSSDFGKVRFGSVKVDPFGGLLAPIRLVSQLTAGAKDKTGKVNDPNHAITLGFYGTGKVSPAYATTRGLIEGNKFGEKFNVTSDEGLKNVAWSFAPISVHTGADIWTNDKLAPQQKALLTIGAFLGLNVNKDQGTTFRN